MHALIQAYPLKINTLSLLKGQFNTEPVSYTHLDVYKRQGKYYEIM